MADDGSIWLNDLSANRYKQTYFGGKFVDFSGCNINMFPSTTFNCYSATANMNDLTVTNGLNVNGSTNLANVVTNTLNTGNAAITNNLSINGNTTLSNVITLGNLYIGNSIIIDASTGNTTLNNLIVNSTINAATLSSNNILLIHIMNYHYRGFQ